MRKVRKYWNITISGKIGTGTTTLAAGLQEELGWTMWSVGDFQRAYVQKHGIRLEDTASRSDAHEKKIEYRMRKKLAKERNLIFEAWLGGFVAQGIAGTLKILLIAPDALRIDRFVNHEGGTIEAAKRHIKKREGENHKKWSRLYRAEWRAWVGKGPIDFYKPALFNLVIDTYSHSKEETRRIALHKLNS